MEIRCLSWAAALTLAIAPTAFPQTAAPNTIVWYNGAWQSGIQGLPNWFAGSNNYCRAYDQFEVPKGGWTITAVFSDNALYDFTKVKRASFEIRRDAPKWNRKSVVIAKVLPATILPDPEVTAPNYPVREVGRHYRVLLDGLNVHLAEGVYWLSVTPVGAGQSFLHPTLGARSVGTGVSRLVALYDCSRNQGVIPATSYGVAAHFSQGVIGK